ncbi:TraC family protein [Candidatus Uhrbacteria bacterium]|nr:TraC family protein [Candidatus Uhrbacteria bacterium]
MQSKKLAGPKPGPATQRSLDIAEIKEEVVVLKDGTLRAVLLCASINFDLKSAEEQQAIIQAYMQFLNALDFPLQIVIQSRRLNIDPYLARLRENERNQTNELLRAQIRDYVNFVGELVTLGDIMSKRFYLVVPFDPLSNKRRGWFSRFREVLTPAVTIRVREERFRDRRDELMQRVNQITSLLANLGVSSALLDTQSLIELYYTVYNPDLYDAQKLRPMGDLQVEE